jgi:hypothetical protein
MPGILKIGRTSRRVLDRVRELDGATGVPTPYTVEATVWSADASAVEAATHAALAARRVNRNREFFRITVEEALAAARAANNGKAIKRWRQRAAAGRGGRKGVAAADWLEGGARQVAFACGTGAAVGVAAGGPAGGLAAAILLASVFTGAPRPLAELLRATRAIPLYVHAAGWAGALAFVPQVRAAAAAAVVAARSSAW